MYGIEERYKAKLCGTNDGKAWLVQVNEWTELGLNLQDFMLTLESSAQKRPYTDCNFLKKPFLEACQEIGLF